MLKPDLVILVMPPTVTITATAPAVPNNHIATGLLDEPFFATAIPASAAEIAFVENDDNSLDFPDILDSPRYPDLGPTRGGIAPAQKRRVVGRPWIL